MPPYAATIAALEAFTKSASEYKEDPPQLMPENWISSFLNVVGLTITFAPFDKIIVTCGAPDVPQTLLDQLKIGGKMVIPVGEGAEQKMLRIHKTTETTYTTEEFGTFKFVPMLERTVK